MYICPLFFSAEIGLIWTILKSEIEQIFALSFPLFLFDIFLHINFYFLWNYLYFFFDKCVEAIKVVSIFGLRNVLKLRLKKNEHTQKYIITKSTQRIILGEKPIQRTFTFLSPPTNTNTPIHLISCCHCKYTSCTRK